MSFTCACWLSYADKVLGQIAPRKKEIDFLVCTGLSGQSIGFVVSRELKIPLLILRKPGSVEHSKKANANPKWAILEGVDELKRATRHLKHQPRVCFVDDCISQGLTRRRCGAAVHKFGAEMCYQAAPRFEIIPTDLKEVFTKEAKTAKVYAYD